VTTAQTPVNEDRLRRAVVVTGALSVIGMSTAERLARAGHLVVLGVRRIEVVEKAAARLRAEGASAFAVHLDLADTSSIDKFVDAARYLVGTVDVLVCNTDVSRPFADVSVPGAQHLAAQLIPAMIDKGGGDLVFVSSGAVGRRPRPRIPVYSAPRYALEAWVAVLRAELEGTGVRVSVVRQPDEVVRVVTTVIDPQETTQLRLVEGVPSAPRTVEATN
jgi:NADP-dependent 3-hydroxy acid dehydrogenase YdfG